MSRVTSRQVSQALRIHSLSLAGAVLLCLTLGLAPYLPEPHIAKQIRNLFTGKLHAPIDILDLVIHGFPFVVLTLVGGRVVREAHALSRKGK